MKKIAIICLANGIEETEAVTVIDLLIRSNIKVITASLNKNNNLTIIGSQKIKLLADTSLNTLSNSIFDAIILPGGLKGVHIFQESSLLLDLIQNFYNNGKLVAAICASPALVLQRYTIFKNAKMTSFPPLKEHIPESNWVDKRVVYDNRFKLLTSQGLGTSINFALKIIELLKNNEEAIKIANQIILPPGIYPDQ